MLGGPLRCPLGGFVSCEKGSCTRAWPCQIPCTPCSRPAGSLPHRAHAFGAASVRLWHYLLSFQGFPTMSPQRQPSTVLLPCLSHPFSHWLPPTLGVWGSHQFHHPDPGGLQKLAAGVETFPATRHLLEQVLTSGSSVLSTSRAGRTLPVARSVWFPLGCKVRPTLKRSCLATVSLMGLCGDLACLQKAISLEPYSLQKITEKHFTLLFRSCLLGFLQPRPGCCSVAGAPVAQQIREQNHMRPPCTTAFPPAWRPTA